MKPMLPTLRHELPSGNGWLYEVKYDGFRGILSVQSSDQISLQSRNGKELLSHFPEIKRQIQQLLDERAFPLPLILDGEVALLRSSFSTEFQELQVRGRMRNDQKILQAAASRPVTFLVFDLLQSEKKSYIQEPYLTRKEKLKEVFTRLHLPLEPDPSHPSTLQMVPFYKKLERVWELVLNDEGEGVVAKRDQSKWDAGKRSANWIKCKNWKHCQCFITALDDANDYFHIGVYDNGQIMPIGLFHFGLSAEEKRTVKTTIKQNSTGKEHSLYYIDPAITVEILYLHWQDGKLREPHFKQFLFPFLRKHAHLTNL